MPASAVAILTPSIAGSVENDSGASGDTVLDMDELGRELLGYDVASRDLWFFKAFCQVKASPGRSR
jgi:hypothetical protein